MDEAGGYKDAFKFAQEFGEKAVKQVEDSIPKLTSIQSQILNIFNELSRERQTDSCIKRREITELSKEVSYPYPLDIMNSVLTEIDNHYLQYRVDKVKRDSQNGRNKIH